MNRKILLGLLYGGCFFLFCMMLYFCIISVKHFMKFSDSRERKRQTLHFSKEKNQYSAIIQVYPDDVYYLNWYPKMVLNTKINDIGKRDKDSSQKGTDVSMSRPESLSQKDHLREANNGKLSHSPIKENLEGEKGKCIFINSKGFVKTEEIQNVKNFTFTVGPVTEGSNIIKLSFPPDYDRIPDLTCDIIFSETSNSATPWIWLAKAMVSALLFIALTFIPLLHTGHRLLL